MKNFLLGDFLETTWIPTRELDIVKYWQTYFTDLLKNFCAKPDRMSPSAVLASTEPGCEKSAEENLQMPMFRETGQVLVKSRT